ncbi:MAG TPA: lipopolysaccharide biosynthesis protein [Candidatus Competibacter sp.]|nr:lipopolysaccharide biosynthesis protein [Candidatus Competibacter sp.]
MKNAIFKLEYFLSLHQKSLRAVFWSGADVFMRQGLQFFISILLARLLAPEDFGVIAMLYVFIGLAGLFIDSGFSSALIQRQDTTHTDESTVFFFNLGMGALMALALCAAAPWIATFFELPILQNLTYVMALNLFIGAFGSIHNTLLTKTLNFKTIMKVGGVATFCSGLLAIAMAWWGFGVWSLAWQTLLSSLITVSLLWWWHPWRPHWEFSLLSLSRLFRFGGFLMLSGLLDTVYTRLYAVLIGKFFSARELGYYTRAESTQQLPVSILTGVLNRVAFPVFSEAAVDPQRLARGLRKVLVAIMLLNIPAMLGLAVVAEPLVVTLFGAKWLPCVPFLQVLCLAGVLWPLHVINLNALMAQGRSDLFFRIEVIKKVVGVVLLVLASLHSVMAIAWLRLLLGVFSFFINAHYSGVLLGYGPWRQLRDILPYGGVAMVMAVSVGWAGHALHWPPAAELVALSVLGATFYWVACRWLRLAAFDEVITMIRRRNDLRPASSGTVA